VRAIQAALREAGLRLVLLSSVGFVSDVIVVVRSLGYRFVVGLIICPIRPDEALLDAVQTAAAPVVVIGNVPGGVAVDNVRGQSFEGAALATRHLVERGSSRVALINGPEDTMPGQGRRAGYEDVLRSLGTYDPVLVEAATDFSFESGYAAAKQLLARGAVFNGLLGITDRLALGALHALRDAGLTTPGDVRLVGMDNSEVAATSAPTLTSVDLGAIERGRLAAELMITRLADRDLPPRSLTVGPTLIERDSTR
jgi:LacI family transcriptional regulator